MEKEQILSELKVKLGKTSLSERTLSAYVDGNLPSEGAQPDDAYWNTHVAFLKSLAGNFSHDVAQQVEAFKKSYKPEPTPNPAPEPTPAEPVGDDALSKRIEALENMLKAEKAKNLTDALRKGIQAKGEELKVSNKALWNDAVMLVEIGDDTTADTLLDKAKQVYEAKLRAYIGDGASPYGGLNTPSTTVSEQDAKDKREAFKKRMQANGRLPKND